MRLILASIVGTVIVFAWGGLSWMVMDLWSNDLRELPNADALMPAIKANVGETGAYAFPPMVESDGRRTRPSGGTLSLIHISEPTRPY